MLAALIGGSATIAVAPAFAAAPPEAPTGDGLPTIYDASVHPTIIGIAAGDQLCATNGRIGGDTETGTGWALNGGVNPSFSYQWQYSIGDSAWADIGGQTSQCITSSGAGPHEAVVYLVQVTLTTNLGSASTTNEVPFGPFYAGLQLNEVQPVVSDTEGNVPPQIGDQVCATTGGWGGGVTGYAYQWYADGGIAITGATSQCYTITAADLNSLPGYEGSLQAGYGNYTLTAAVAAENSSGLSNYVYASNTTQGVSPAGAPSAIILPSITDSNGNSPPHIGDTLCVDNGSWTDAASDSYTYSWEDTTQQYPLNYGDESPQCITTYAGYLGDPHNGPLGSVVEANVTVFNGTASSTYELSVGPLVGTLTQSSATSATVPDGAGYSGALAVTGASGTVSYAEGHSDSPLLSVNANGTIAAASSLSPGTYTVNGTATDSVGDNGSWTFTLTVHQPITLVQDPSDESTTVGQGFSGPIDFLALLNGTGAIAYQQTSGAPQLTVSNTGLVSVHAGLLPGQYMAGGTDSDALGDTGTFTYTVHIVGTLVQTSPTSDYTFVDPGFTGYSNAITVSGAIGPVTYTETNTPYPDLSVASDGTITGDPSLSPGSYVLSGTDSDANGDTGTWSFTLGAQVTLAQDPTTESASVVAGTAYSGQLGTTNGIGPFIYVEDNLDDDADISVTSSGAISAAASLPPGTYTVIGNTFDTNQDNGTWTFTLTVSLPQDPSSLSATVPFGTEAVGNLAVDGAVGSVSYTEDTSAASSQITVDNFGDITADPTLAPGTYTITGEDTDSNSPPDGGTWSFTLTVSPNGTLDQDPGNEQAAVVYGQSYTDSLDVTDAIGTVTYTETSSGSLGLSVGSDGTLSAADNIPAGNYVVSGTDVDQNGDVGTWTFNLFVEMTQSSAPSATVAQGAGYAGAVTFGGATRAVTFGEYFGAASADVVVDANGNVTASGSLAPGDYTVSGYAVDAAGNVGFWSFTLTVSRIPQSVAFASTAPNDPAVGTTYVASASASSGLGVSLSIDVSSTPGACSLGADGRTLTFSAEGFCVLDANQPGDANYAAAGQQQQSMLVVVAGLSQVSDANGTDPGTSTPDGAVTASATGTGTIVVGEYAGAPLAAPAFESGGTSIDVSQLPGSTFSSLTFSDCDLGGATVLQWWNPAANGGLGGLQPVSDQLYSPGAPPCITVTVSNTTSPDLAQLTGTIFFAPPAEQGPSSFKVTFAQGPFAAGTGVISLTVTALDASGAKLTGFHGPVTVTDLTGSISAPTLSWSNGVGRGTATVADAAHTDAITVQAGAASGTSGTFTVLGPAISLKVQASPSPFVAGKTFTLTVTAEDAFGDAVWGFDAPLIVTDQSGTITTTSAFIWSNGVGKAQASIRTATAAGHTDKITVSLAPPLLVSGTSATFAVGAPAV